MFQQHVGGLILNSAFRTARLNSTTVKSNNIQTNRKFGEILLDLFMERMYGALLGALRPKEISCQFYSLGYRTPSKPVSFSIPPVPGMLWSLLHFFIESATTVIFLNVTFPCVSKVGNHLSENLTESAVCFCLRLGECVVPWRKFNTEPTTELFFSKCENITIVLPDGISVKFITLNL